MSGSDEEMYEDHEIDPQAHEKLLSGVNRLRRTQHIKPPTRTEASKIIDEFHMTKTVVTDKPLFTINDLVDGLKKSKKHLSLAKKLKKIHQPNKILEVPLETPVADRIQRSIGYDNVKKKLSRWDAVVAQSRSAEQQVFPLDCETIHINTGALKKPPQRSFKSDLMIEMEKLDAQLEEVRKLRNPKDDSSNKIDDDNENDIQEKLTRDELIARRKEIQYLRIKESEKSSKLRLKNKIKSKKYHKLLKREKLREQLKEFEILRKTNPELALEKLEKIEKNRVQERASLRHKNTGTWAKNLQVRAKYDKDVRKDLAEQLALSRELTHKKKSDDEDDDDDDNESDEDNGIEDKIHDESYDPFNPWVTVKGKKSQKNEIAEFLSGYRKYWMERNKAEKDLKKFNENPEDDSENTKEEQSSNVDDKIEDKPPQDDDDDKHELEDAEQDDSMSEDSESDQKLNSKVEDFTMKIKKRTQSPQTSDKKLKNKTNKVSKKNINKIVENGWVIEEIDKNVTEKIKLKSIDAIFDEAEDILEERVQQKINKLSKDLDSDEKNKKSSKKSHNKDELKQLKDLSFKEPTNRPEFDEELLETSAKEKDTSSLELSIRNENNVNLNETSPSQNEQIEQIDPNKYLKIKPKSLRTSLPDMINSDALNDSLNIENDDDDNDNENFKKQLTIMEAFEDDDIVVDFQKERDNDCKKTDAEDIDLSLPGWGTWAGCGISKDKQIKKRIIFKLPKEVERRDKNKTNVYINEDISKDLKGHLVSDLPFPFTCVGDFESSIRQPLGRTFIPETAFRMLTRPSVITKQGKIIDPLDESALLKPEPKPKHIVDKRISKLNEKINKKKLMKKQLSKISK